MNTDNLEETLEACFISANVMDSNFEPANLVDVVNRLAGKVERHAEAVEGAARCAEAGLARIADAILELAQAVRDADPA